MHWRSRGAVLLAATAAGLSGCGSDERPAGSAEDPAAGQSTQAQPPAGEGTSESSCANVPVPGHEATELRAQGVSCARATEVAAAALGKGRRPYQAGGLSCEPSDAGGGDTTYVCTGGDARVTFRYGAA